MEREDAHGAGRGPGSARKQDRRRLPPELTGLLPRKLEHGLDHVARRRILRALHDEREFSSAQLSRGPLDDLSLSLVAYHMSVLSNYKMVRLVRTLPNRGVIEHFYASEVEDNPVVTSILEKTEELDAARRGGGDP